MRYLQATKYNIERSNTWKAILLIFTVFVMIVLISSLQGSEAVGYTIMIASFYWLGFSTGWFMYKYNWKARKKIKREAIEELVQKFDWTLQEWTVDEMMKAIERP